MKKLTAEELVPFKNLLLKMRARLRGDVDAITENALQKNRMETSVDGTSMPIHMADVGTDNFEQEFSLSLMMNESETLAQVEDALLRIQQETYGDCEDCGARITKARLHAVPHTTMCIHCAEKSEANAKQVP
ncbi:MAG: TraR/DksA family transcriptional regulator [Thermoguttaceae bacterium]